MCVNVCPNDCLHMTTELRVDVLDSAEGDWEGYGLNWKLDDQQRYQLEILRRLLKILNL